MQLGAFVHWFWVEFYIEQMCYFLPMQTTEAKISAREQRRIRDVAFAKLLEDMKPENQLKSQMIAARIRAGLTQKELAKRMGTHQPAIARLENGRSLPSIGTLRKLAEITGSRLILRLDGPMRS
jgi:DNA-binding XRE family transcriptional regulator